MKLSYTGQINQIQVEEIIQLWNRFRTARINCMHVEWIKHRLKGSSIGHIDRFQGALIKSGLTTVEQIIYRPN